MKTIIVLAMVMVLCSSQSFAGGGEKCVLGAIDAAGLGDTVIREVSRPFGVLASAKDVAMVGTAAVTVSGTSGAGIVSTMAAVGKPLAAVTAGMGGATIAGTVLCAGSGGLGAAGLLNEFVFDGDTEADQAARVGTYVGAGGATLGGVATVAAAGTTGLSAAGITSGLAAIGGAMGGGMAAGTIIVVAAPVAAAAAIGGLVYWLFSD